MIGNLVHRYAGPWLAACGLEGPMTVHVDAAKVTCPDCKATEGDPAATSDFDQLQAALRQLTGGSR